MIDSVRNVRIDTEEVLYVEKEFLLQDPLVQRLREWKVKHPESEIYIICK